MDPGLAERAESMFVRSGKHVLHRLLTRVTSMQGGSMKAAFAHLELVDLCRRACVLCFSVCMRKITATEPILVGNHFVHLLSFSVSQKC